MIIWLCLFSFAVLVRQSTSFSFSSHRHYYRQFQATPATTALLAVQHPTRRSKSQLNARRTLVKCEEDILTSADIRDRNHRNSKLRPSSLVEPLNDANDKRCSGGTPMRSVDSSMIVPAVTSTGLATALALITTTSQPLPALAASAGSVISTGSLDPSGFVPVCPTSDGFYRLLQGSTEAVVGREAFVEYGPLIAGGLLRIRLELCVVESFINEAVVPFIKQNGVSWILPLHESVETFLAGVIFALAATFILIGSTKIITIIITYTDFLIGFPCRLLGGFSFDRAQGKPVTLDIGFWKFKTRIIGPPAEEIPEQDWSKLGPVNLVTLGVSGTVKSIGIVLGFLREVLDGLDVFVGRYLVLWATFYILVKFVHFKVFPDFP